ncbi:MAG TPA: hypothetical protein VHE78_01200 [Gemmatimonadaceae bacterium]|nr:hypothetical protein [Gemmatimonadaceae bacterium]
MHLGLGDAQLRADYFALMLEFQVEGRVRISWNGHDVEAWKVIFDFGSFEMTRWIDPVSHKALQSRAIVAGSEITSIMK